MSTFAEKMTAVADNIRTLSGTTDKLNLDTMITATNTVVKDNSTSNTLIEEQTELIADIQSALATKSGAAAASTFSLRSSGITQLITNDDSLTITGEYASAFTGEILKVGYTSAGEILLIMQGDGTSSYENIRYVLASAPEGVTINYGTYEAQTSSTSGQLYGCIISGLNTQCEMTIAINTRNTTYDYYQVDITLTEV